MEPGAGHLKMIPFQKSLIYFFQKDSLSKVCYNFVQHVISQYFAYVYEKEAYFYNINGITAYFKQNPKIEVGIEHL